VRNAGPATATLDVLPTLYFRNTWSWGLDPTKPSLTLEDGAVVAEHPQLGRRVLSASGGPGALFRDNETNIERLWGVPSRIQYPKDGINDHVVHAAETANREHAGTKAAFRYRVEVPAGETTIVELRLAEDAHLIPEAFDSMMRLRAQEADEFYAELTPAGASEDAGRCHHARAPDDGAAARLHDPLGMVHGQPPRGSQRGSAHPFARTCGLADALDRR
jgi:hypothetical protein